jgi:hypothetical protein
MRLRPRYSLLTLLILTALVAGGVKLWYGPHWVKERKTPTKEIEYTYTRDWHGNTFVQGPCIVRVFGSDGTMRFINVVFFRQGHPLSWEYSLGVLSKDWGLPAAVVDDQEINFVPFQGGEKAAFVQAIQAARNEKTEPRAGWYWDERLKQDFSSIAIESIQDFADFERVYDAFLRDPKYLPLY